MLGYTKKLVFFDSKGLSKQDAYALRHGHGTDIQCGLNHAITVSLTN